MAPSAFSRALSAPRAGVVLALAAALGGLGGATAARVDLDILEEASVPRTSAAGAAAIPNKTREETQEDVLLEAAAVRVNRSDKVENEPSKYVSYIQPISQAIVTNNKADLSVGDYDAGNTKTRTGFILFNTVGTCPASFMCGDQAVTFAYFEGEVLAYWSKPQPIAQCTRDRHVKKGKCKNDSDKFQKLQDLFKAGGDYSVDLSTERAVVMNGQERMYIYLVYASDYSTWYQTMDGWLLYQRDPKAEEYFRVKFHSDSDAKFTFFGEGQRMPSFWPSSGEVDV